MYFDQWAAMYNRYMVRGCKVKAFLVAGQVDTANGYLSPPTATAYGVPGLVLGLLGTPDSTTTPAVATGLASPACGIMQRADVYRVTVPTVTASSSSAVPALNETLMLKRYYSIKKLFGRTLTDALEGGAVGGNPSALANMYVFLGGPQTTLADVPATFTTVLMEFKFYCEFASPVQVANS